MLLRKGEKAEINNEYSTLTITETNEGIVIEAYQRDGKHKWILRNASHTAELEARRL